MFSDEAGEGFAATMLWRPAADDRPHAAEAGILPRRIELSTTLGMASK